MTIHNATIKSVTVGLHGSNQALSAKVEFCDSAVLCYHAFDLTDWTAVAQLTVLMNYLEVQDLNDLEGKRIRTVMSEGLFRGFGHPTKDQFIVVSFYKGKYPMRVSKKEFENMLKHHSSYWD